MTCTRLLAACSEGQHLGLWRTGNRRMRATLIMTMALAVVMIACEAAAGKPGEAGEAGPPGEPAPKLPYLTKGFSPVELAATGEMATKSISLAGHFTDPHEGQLTYSASPEPSGVVTTAVSDSTLTLTAVGEGKATVTVAAKNKDGVSAFNPGAQFTVTVMETVAPTVEEGGIPDQILYKDDGEQMLTLTKADADSMGYFSHAGDITYIVDDLPKGFIEATEADGVLTLKPLVTGETIVTVVATADNKSTDPVKFTVTVEKGTAPPPVPEPQKVAPNLSKSIDGMMLYLGDSPNTKMIDLSGHFTHPRSTITYAASVSVNHLSAVVAGSNLTLTPVTKGNARVTVTATADDMDTTASFNVEVKDGKTPPKVPPAPPPPPIDSVPSELTIDSATKPYKEVELPANHTLKSKTESVVTVMKKAGTTNTWKVMSVSKGTSMVDVLDGSGTVAKTIMVKVTVAPQADSCRSSITLDPGMGRDTYECVLADGESLTSDNTDKVRVEPKHGETKNVWVITAVAKTGKTPVTVFYVGSDGATKSGMSIKVTVENQAPKRVEADPTGFMNLFTAVADTANNVTARHHVTGRLNLASYFEDADSDILTYKAVVSPKVALVKVDKDGYVDIKAGAGVADPSDSSTAVTDNAARVVLDVLRNFGDYFTITFHAYDGEAMSKGSVSFKFLSTDPKSGIYTALQYARGSIIAVDIGGRIGVDHTINVHDAGATGDTKATGFTFAEEYLKKLAKEKRIAPVDSSDVNASTSSESISKQDTESGEGDSKVIDDAGKEDYYTIKGTGSITAKWHATSGTGKAATVDLSAVPQIKINAKRTGLGTVTITYHVWQRKAGDYHDADNDANDVVDGQVWKSMSQTITVNVQSCSEFSKCK